MSFVLISHASPDKPRVRPIVDALRTAGLKIWLDNPAAAGYEAEQIASFYRVRANGRWEDEIDDAKREAACILVCWSQRATAAGVMDGRSRLTWMGEADYGRVERKLVACTIDDVNPADLPGTHSAQQMPCVDPVGLPPETWRAVMATLIDDVRRKMDERTNRKFGSRAARQDLALPFLANRSRQSDDFYGAISAAAGDGGVHPVILKGPKNELPDVFLERMKRTSSALAVGRFEVTFDEYDACVAAKGCAQRPGDEGWGRGRRPVINVSWQEAVAYARWLSGKTGQRYRLLTEAEWEYAARAGTTTPYPWGPSASHEYANYGAEQCCSGLASGRDQWVNTAPAGQFPANRFGLHDVHGNVSEWVEDCYADSYAGLRTNGLPNTTGSCSDRVLRGGSWDDSPQDLRSASRGWGAPTIRYSGLGFRLARTL